MHKTVVVFFLLFLTLSASAQTGKDSLIRELSAILNKSAGLIWKGGSISNTIQQQSAGPREVVLVMQKAGFDYGTKVDGKYTYKYTFAWDSLTKFSTIPPKNSLSGCSEKEKFCTYQLNFKANSLTINENGKVSNNPWDSWFEVYIRLEDKDKYFQLLQQLYQLLHP